VTILFFDFGSGEIFLIVLAIFLVFGPGKIPELARTLGKFINEIKRASEDVRAEINREADRIEIVKDKKLEKTSPETKESEPEDAEVLADTEKSEAPSSDVTKDTGTPTTDEPIKEPAVKLSKNAAHEENGENSEQDTISIKPADNTVTSKG